jgi:hypothetical protein
LREAADQIQRHLQPPEFRVKGLEVAATHSHFALVILPFDTVFPSV